MQLLLGFAVASCTDGPTGPGRDYTISFCVAPVWAAYRNEGEPWRQLALPADVVRLTERVVIASKWAGSGASLDIQHLTADQAAAAYNCPLENGLGKTVHA
ncbi:MAG: hypothetical protein ACRENU_09450, partial [Gemmatimonadaceae bacterium]